MVSGMQQCFFIVGVGGADLEAGADIISVDAVVEVGVGGGVDVLGVLSSLENLLLHDINFDEWLR